MKITSDKKYYVNYCQFPRGKNQILNSLILPDNQTTAAASADTQASDLMFIPKQEARPDGHTQGLMIIPSQDPRPDAQGRAMTLIPRETQILNPHPLELAANGRFCELDGLNNYFFSEGIGGLFWIFEVLRDDPHPQYIIPNKRGSYGD